MLYSRVCEIGITRRERFGGRNTIRAGPTLGAAATINARSVANVVEAVREVTAGGAHVSLDALGQQLNAQTVALRSQAEELTASSALIVPATEPIAAVGRELDQLTEQLRRADAMA